MKILSLLSIFLPVVASVALPQVDSTPGLDSSQQCSLECKVTYDLWMATLLDDVEKVMRSHDDVCHEYNNVCPDCGYCDLLIHEENQSNADSTKQEHTSIGNDKDVSKIGSRAVTEVCSRGDKRCSQDGSHLQVCGFSGSWRWLDKQNCGKGCCDYIMGTRQPMCMCLKPPHALLGGDEVDDADHSA
ncbi:hypothetical protein K505DRAFT_331206 [Melanomma pulvis-pyrius CBS 109.77]|uniref:Cyanovirin-N domain-containing protein n=1 Tax=Melanomma pulvis-pyrius CBS 109.77 TaxID=1314802 RepID=A0A6A6XWY1_9PLEO|nr:hypothetical protein K505DRAFT_331206 [Melanomma pulvis-pyrius CBS 109.77]